MLPVSMTLILIIIISVVSFIAFNNRKFYDAWILYPYRMEEKKEYYRFLTSGLIHASITHWLFNMVAFYFSGSNLEYSIGSIHVAAILILGIVLSDLPTFVKHRNNRGYRSLGASGGVSAIIFASIMLHPLDRMFLFGMPAFMFAILYLIYSYYQSKMESGDNINHSAHFYGAVIGIAYILVINPFTIITFFEEIINWSI